MHPLLARRLQKEEAAAAPAHQPAAEAPEWELYNQQQQQQKEKRFKFKKGKGRKADDEEEDEVRGLDRGMCGCHAAPLCTSQVMSKVSQPAPFKRLPNLAHSIHTSCMHAASLCSCAAWPALGFVILLSTKQRSTHLSNATSPACSCPDSQPVCDSSACVPPVPAPPHCRMLHQSAPHAGTSGGFFYSSSTCSTASTTSSRRQQKDKDQLQMRHPRESSPAQAMQLQRRLRACRRHPLCLTTSCCGCVATLASCPSNAFSTATHSFHSRSVPQRAGLCLAQPSACTCDTALPLHSASVQAIERPEADADLLGLGGRRKAKEKGMAAAKDFGIEYGDGGKVGSLLLSFVVCIPQDCI